VTKTTTCFVSKADVESPLKVESFNYQFKALFVSKSLGQKENLRRVEQSRELLILFDGLG
jgi:hypothetical protein